MSWTSKTTASLTRKKISIIFAASVVVITLAAYLWWLHVSRWKITLVESLPMASGGEHRRILCSNHQGSFEATCVVFDRGAVRYGVIDLGSDSTKTLNEVFEEQKPLAIFNGGYFDAERKPVGLLRVNQETISELVDRPPFSGCFIVDRSGEPALIARSEMNLATTYSAIQSGPFLIDPGGEIGIHSDSSPPAERTIIATDQRKICIIFTTPVGLLALSHCLRAHANTFGLEQIDRALNLDGGPSTAFVIQTRDTRLVREPRGKLRDAVIVRPK